MKTGKHRTPRLFKTERAGQQIITLHKLQKTIIIINS